MTAAVPPGPSGGPRTSPYPLAETLRGAPRGRAWLLYLPGKIRKHEKAEKDRHDPAKEPRCDPTQKKDSGATRQKQSNLTLFNPNNLTLRRQRRAAEEAGAARQGPGRAGARAHALSRSHTHSLAGCVCARVRARSSLQPFARFSRFDRAAISNQSAHMYRSNVLRMMRVHVFDTRHENDLTSKGSKLL